METDARNKVGAFGHSITEIAASTMSVASSSIIVPAVKPCSEDGLLRQSASSNSSLPDAEVTAIVVLQVISMRSSKNAEVKPKQEASNPCSGELQIRRKARSRVRVSYKSKGELQIRTPDNEKVPRVRVISSSHSRLCTRRGRRGV